MKFIKYLIPVFLLIIGISACTENAPEEPEQEAFKPDLLIGEWTIKAVYKSNGDKINSVSDGSFEFGDDKMVTINLAGFPGIDNGVPMSYELNEKTISNVGEFKLNFDVVSLTNTKLTMKSDIRGMKLAFELEK
jgi:hypothetical protein